MRVLSVIPVLVVAAVMAGCAQTGPGSTSAMGGSPSERTVMCRDAAWVTSTSQCGDHGGVERAMTPSSQR